MSARHLKLKKKYNIELTPKSQCDICHKKFNITRRRLWCYRCWRNCCKACLPHTTFLKGSKNEKPICDRCHMAKVREDVPAMPGDYQEHSELTILAEVHIPYKNCGLRSLPVTADPESNKVGTVSKGQTVQVGFITTAIDNASEQLARIYNLDPKPNELWHKGYIRLKYLQKFRLSDGTARDVGDVPMSVAGQSHQLFVMVCSGLDMPPGVTYVEVYLGGCNGHEGRPKLATLLHRTKLVDADKNHCSNYRSEFLLKLPVHFDFGIAQELCVTMVVVAKTNDEVLGSCRVFLSLSKREVTTEHRLVQPGCLSRLRVRSKWITSRPKKPKPSSTPSNTPSNTPSSSPTSSPTITRSVTIAIPPTPSSSPTHPPIPRFLSSPKLRSRPRRLSVSRRGHAHSVTESDAFVPYGESLKALPGSNKPSLLRGGRRSLGDEILLRDALSAVVGKRADLRRWLFPTGPAAFPPQSEKVLYELSGVRVYLNGAAEPCSVGTLYMTEWRVVMVPRWYWEDADPRHVHRDSGILSISFAAIYNVKLTGQHRHGAWAMRVLGKTTPRVYFAVGHAQPATDGQPDAIATLNTKLKLSRELECLSQMTAEVYWRILELPDYLHPGPVSGDVYRGRQLLKRVRTAPTPPARRGSSAGHPGGSPTPPARRASNAGHPGGNGHPPVGYIPAVEDYRRMGLLTHRVWAMLSEGVNARYQVCASYPRALLFPRYLFHPQARANRQASYPPVPHSHTEDGGQEWVGKIVGVHEPGVSVWPTPEGGSALATLKCVPLAALKPGSRVRVVGVTVTEAQVMLRVKPLQPHSKWSQGGFLQARHCHSEDARVWRCPRLQRRPRDVQDAAKCRSRGRLPVLVWVHPDTEAPLCRCAQPNSGLGKGYSSRLKADHELLNAIRASVHHDSRLTIWDARPWINAEANAVKGKGFEDVKHLGNNFSLEFLNVGNIHKMRSSLLPTLELDASDSLQTQLDESNWLAHLSLVLSGALRIARALHEGRGEPALVHCSDGWDRTAQLCATTELLLDPFYRTISGFATLVQKEWVDLGHKFRDRAQGRGAVWAKDESSPIFLQWLDVVRQIMRQFPSHFEFRPNLLVWLADACYSGNFRNFLANNDRERLGSAQYHHVACVWTAVHHSRALFLNPTYRGGGAGGGARLLQVDASPAGVHLWTELFLRTRTPLHTDTQPLGVGHTIVSPPAAHPRGESSPDPGGESTPDPGGGIGADPGGEPEFNSARKLTDFSSGAPPSPPRSCLAPRKAAPRWPLSNLSASLDAILAHLKPLQLQIPRSRLAKALTDADGDLRLALKNLL